MIRKLLKFLPAGIAFSPEPGTERPTIQIITEKTWHILDCWLRIVASRGEQVYLDFMHYENEVPAFFISEFVWLPYLGIFAKGEWSKLGEQMAKQGLITGVSSSLPCKGLTAQAARRWVPNVREARNAVTDGDSVSTPATVAPLADLPPVVVEPFLPLFPWPDVGTVAIAPVKPALVECRINALIGARSMSHS